MQWPLSCPGGRAGGVGLRCPQKTEPRSPHPRPFEGWRRGPCPAQDSSASRAHQEPTSTFTKIYRRSFCLLQAWLEDCYSVDFVRNAGLLGRLQHYLSSQVRRGARGTQPPVGSS